MHSNDILGTAAYQYGWHRWGSLDEAIAKFAPFVGTAMTDRANINSPFVAAEPCISAKYCDRGILKPGRHQLSSSGSESFCDSDDESREAALSQMDAARMAARMAAGSIAISEAPLVNSDEERISQKNLLKVVSSLFNISLSSL